MNFQQKLLHYLDDDENEGEQQQFIQYLEKSNIVENRKECKLLIRLLLVLVNNHHRTAYFLDKIERILSILKIKQTFSNSEIYKLFSPNKRILLYIIQENILSIDDFISFSKISDKNSPENKNYLLIAYFWTEIYSHSRKTKVTWPKKLIRQYITENIDDFLIKRKNGENDTYICQLIQKDSIVDFITYVNRNNISLSNTIIEPSIFESNTLLIENPPSLIEYAAFYGSIQIFQFLQLNNVELKPSLWIYAIHGRNPEIIHLLEYNHVNPPSNKSEYEFEISYEICHIESIKCHHYELTEYIENNLLINKSEYEFYFNLVDDENDKIKPYCFEYYSYSNFPSNLNNQMVLNYLCKFDYAALLDIYLKNIDIDPNFKTTRTIFYIFKK